MIPSGTLCIVTYAVKEAQEYIGRFCTVIRRIPLDDVGHDCVIRFNDGFELFGADKCLLPIDAPPTEETCNVIAKYDTTTKETK